MNNKALNYFLFLFIFIFNYLILEFFLIRIDNLNFIENNIFSPDAWVNHINATRLNNAKNFYDFISIIKDYYINFYNIYPIFLSFIYRISTHINFILLLNSAFLTLIAFKFNKIIEFTLNKNYFYIPVFFILFNPIIILSTVQPLKEIFVIYFSVCLVLEIIKIFQKKKKNYLPILIYTIFLFFLRFYQPILILISVGLFFFISNIYNKIKYNKNYFDFSYLFIFFSFVILVYLFNYFDLYNFFNQFRINDLKQNLVNNYTFISINKDHYTSIIMVFLNLPKLIFLGLLEPLPLLFYKSNYQIFNIYIVYHVIYILLILGNFFLIFSKHNRTFNIILVVSIIPIIILSFFITNLGTLIRIKSFYTILLLLFGFAGWIEIISSNFINKISVQKLIYHNKNILISILFSILTFILLFLRDLFVIEEVEFDLKSDFFYLITFSVTIVSYALCSPLYEIFNKYLIKKEISSIKNIFLFSLFINFLFSIFLILFLYFIFGINFIFDGSNYLLLLSIINIPIGVFLILGNVIISTKKDPIFVVFGGIIVPILCIFFILFLKFNIFYEILLGLILGQIINLFYIYFLIFNSSQLNYLIRNLITTKSQISNNNYYELINSIILNLFLFLPFIFATLYFIRLSESYVSYWVLFSKIIFTIFFFIIGFININFLSSLFNFKNLNKEEKILFLNKILLITFNILILITVTVLLIYILFIDPLLNNELKAYIFNDISKILLIIPFFTYVFISIKFNLFHLNKINFNLIFFLFILIIINWLCSIYIYNTNIYLFSIFAFYFSSIFIIKVITLNYDKYFYYWLLFNILCILIIFILDNNYVKFILFINIMFTLPFSTFSIFVQARK